MNAPGNTQRDARRTTRHRVGTLAPVLNTMTQRVLGVTRDISSGGLRVQAPAPLVDNALYQVQVELEGTGNRTLRIEAGVQVVRQERSEGGGALVGMRFIHLDSSQRERLAGWLASPI